MVDAEDVEEWELSDASEPSGEDGPAAVGQLLGKWRAPNVPKGAGMSFTLCLVALVEPVFACCRRASNGRPAYFGASSELAP